MKIKHHDIEVNPNKPFEACKLDRQKYATVLTEIVNNYSDGFVLAINNEWGTGKTTFVKMWQQHLIIKGFHTIYFNAWENDFDSNPLVAIMSELKTFTNAQNEDLFKSIIVKGAVLLKNVAPSILKAVAKRYIDIDVITEAIENTTQGVTEILESEIKDYAAKKKTITEFRKELAIFIKKTSSDKPLIFIIDELDRCRPDYAVEVLEQLKHFFSVQGIVFVLSIDKYHLASSVKGFYGCESINTDEYLRRFFDLEFTLPKPSTIDYCRYLFEYFSFDKVFSSSDTTINNARFREGQAFLSMAQYIFKITNSTLRQQEKIFAHIRIITSSFSQNEYIHCQLILLLLYIKTMYNALYQKINENSLSVYELGSALRDLLPFNSPVGSSDSVDLRYYYASIIHLYNNNQRRHDRISLFAKDGDKDSTNPNVEEQENKKELSYLGEYFLRLQQAWEYSDLSLNYLLNKINLTEPVSIG